MMALQPLQRETKRLLVLWSERHESKEKNNFRPQFPTKGTNQASIPHKMITILINYKNSQLLSTLLQTASYALFLQQKDQKAIYHRDHR
jgi:hypothetical protein